jgi:OmpA-OmpF porin, OOP family
MKIKLIIAILLQATFAVAQNDENESNNYDHWSIELNVGNNKGVKPYSTGYFSSNPNNYFNFNGVHHFDLGIRYMLSTNFGAKIDFGFDQVKSQEGSGSLPFETNQYRIGFQGVANLARILKFETFTKRFGLLAHTGFQFSKLQPQTAIAKGISEDNGGIMIGLTPQFRLTNSIVITGDFTVINNVRQHLNWDGQYAATENNLSGLLYNTSLGITVYLGKNEKHADWYLTEGKLKDIAGVDRDARRRLDDIETLMNDTDKDGIVDYLDTQNNTPAGVAVDSKGRYIDTNNNGVPDELERKANDGRDGINTQEISKSDAVKDLVQKGYVNVFFDVNEDYPNDGSTNNVYHVINFLRNYPDSKVKLTGFADVRGDEKKNLNLSQRRAQKLYNIIIATGIDKSRVQIQGQGVDSSYPSDTKIGLDLARRVSIIIE